MAKKRDQSELPPIRMVRKGMSLVPADAFSEEMLDGIRMSVPIDVHWTYELMNPKRKKFWAVLNNVIRNCRTPWTNSKAAANALKIHLGVVDEGVTVGGGPFRYPASTLDLSDEEFEVFYEGSMATLHRITGIDPESLRRAAPRVQGEREPPGDQPIGDAEVIENPQAPLEDEAAAAGTDETDERRFVNPDERRAHYEEQGKAASELKDSQLTQAEPFPVEAAVDEIMAYASGTVGSPEERQAKVKAVTAELMAKYPDQTGFLGTVEHHCKRVAKGDLRPGSARAYLISIAPRPATH
jgi:hypothetical protein